MEKEIYKDITVTSKGQLTLPVSIRRALKLGERRKIRLAIQKDGTLTLSPLPDVMAFYGIVKSPVPYDPEEKRKGREAMARSVLRRK